MCQESKPIPIDRDTEEIAVQVTEQGETRVVLIDGFGKREAVAVRMVPVACERGAAA